MAIDVVALQGIFEKIFKDLVTILPGNTNHRKRLCTVDLLIKTACFCKRVKICSILKVANWTSSYKEVNCTEPFPSGRIP
jgi:hypothetical protein